MPNQRIISILAFSLVIVACKPRGDQSIVLADTAPAFSKEDFDKVSKFFESYCVECHGEGGEAGFTFANDMPKLASSALIKKDKPETSKIWQRMSSKSMPPSEASAFPSDEEKEIVLKWIAAGTPLTFGTATGGGRKFFLANQMLDSIAADLLKLPQADRKFMRYLTLRNLYNQSSGGVPLIKDEQLFAFRNGLSFLVNSLHWRKEVTPLTVVANTEKTVLRLDLRRYSSTVGELERLGIRGLAPSSSSWSYAKGYGLTSDAWDYLVVNDPYKISYEGKKAKFIREQTGVEFPFMRGDIFTFLASRSHNAKKPETFKFAYYQILGIEGNFEEFNRAIFGRSISEQLQDGNTSVIRSGFAVSGVSDHNRLLERHVIPSYQASVGNEAAYWLSYDFGGSIGNQHLESHPLGPKSAFQAINGGKRVFSHDGGEVIFSLPNGLHAYMLFTSAGSLLDEGPVNIVRDKKRIVVLNGVSCMDCHKMGMLEKTDTVRAHIDENRDEYTAEELEILDRLYRPLSDTQTLSNQFAYDTKTYLQAKAKTVADKDLFQGAQKYNEAIASGVPDLHDLFVSDVSTAIAASEVDLDEASFKSSLKDTPELRQILGAFLTDGKIVKRETFREFFPQLVKGLDLAKVDSTAGAIALCQGCSVKCQAQIFTPQASPLSPALFEAESKLSEGAARDGALKKCDARLSEGLKTAGYHCKVTKQCVVQNP